MASDASSEGASDADFAAAVETLPGDGMFLLLTPELIIVAASDEYLAATMTRREQIVGRHVWEVFPDNPDVPNWTGIASDISERPRAGASQRQARLLLESTSEGIFGIDEQGLCIFINDAAAEMLGYAPNELRGRDMHDTIHHTRQDGRRYPVEECPIYRAIRANSGCRIEDEVLWRKDGSSFAASYSSSPIMEGGRTIGAVVTFADITQRKCLQAELERTARELADANRELARADKLKDQFLAMASHELRTPLTAIAGFTSTLLNLDDKLSEQQKREFLEIIDRQTGRLQRLVDDLLTLSRIESGAMEPRPELVDVSIAIKQTIRELGAEQVAVARVPEHLEAIADADHLQQILVNYVGNALKYGSDPIRIEARSTGDDVEIRVRDSGPGVPPEFVPQLFERFAQAKHFGAQIEGTGLGLSIVRGLARVQGGDAWYEPNEPHGSCFAVRLPTAHAGTLSDRHQG